MDDFAEPVMDKYVPNGYATMVFNFSGQVNVIDQQKLRMPPYFMVVPLMKNLQVEVNPPIDSFIVHCHASVLSRVFSINMQHISNGHIVVLGDSVFGLLYEKMKSFADPQKRITLFEDFLIQKMAFNLYEVDEIDQIYFSIIKYAGKTHIHDIVQSIGISERTFRRVFQKRVGVNAKSLARLVRVNYLWEKITSAKAVDFQDMLFDCNYYDQSHFIKDFKMLTGELPSYFFRRNLDHVRLISGQNKDIPEVVK
jgi:AraC-like DNA-binding protein